jgi:hypothetical protein
MVSVLAFRVREVSFGECYRPSGRPSYDGHSSLAMCEPQSAAPGRSSAARDEWTLVVGDRMHSFASA